MYLANIIREGRINLVFTTNFDDLVNDALTRFIGYSAVVCAADSEVASINVATARAKIIKLHGDYLFKSLKNTREELERLTTNMGRKFAEFARQCQVADLLGATRWPVSSRSHGWSDAVAEAAFRL